MLRDEDVFDQTELAAVQSEIARVPVNRDTCKEVIIEGTTFYNEVTAPKGYPRMDIEILGDETTFRREIEPGTSFEITTVPVRLSCEVGSINANFMFMKGEGDLLKLMVPASQQEREIIQKSLEQSSMKTISVANLVGTQIDPKSMSFSSFIEAMRIKGEKGLAVQASAMGPRRNAILTGQFVKDETKGDNRLVTTETTDLAMAIMLVTLVQRNEFTLI